MDHSWLQELRNDYALKFNFDSWWILTSNRKKSLKIPKGYSSETVNQRRTDNTMTKRKKPEKDKHRSTKHYIEN